MEPRKAAIMQALDKFVAQRPGLEFGNYGDVKAYRSEMRSITRDRHDYQTLARAVERSDSITADVLARAFEGAFSGRLSLTIAPEGRVALEYTTGQYFPTEYRKAACAVLAAALWENVRSSYTEEQVKAGNHEKPYPAGDWLRAHFRKEFGRSIANRWFS